MAPFGDEYIQDKKELLSCLRAFGFGGNKAGEENILVNLEYLSDHLLQTTGTEIDLSSLITQTNANIILKILFNKRYEFNDQFLKTFGQMWRDWYAIGGIELWLDQLPWWIVNILARKTVKDMVYYTTTLRDFVKQEVMDHLDTLDKNNPRDFTDMYIITKGDRLDVDRLTDSAFTFCPDAIDTTTNVLDWILLYVTLHQNVQRKMQEEMLKVRDVFCHCFHNDLFNPV